MRLTVTTFTLAVLAALTLSTTATAAPPAPSFDSDCVRTEWVIRNHGLEPFTIGTPDGDVVLAVGAVWTPDTDGYRSVIIHGSVVIRPSCEILAPASTPTRTQLPSTGTSLTLAILAAALITAGSVAWRVGRN